MNISKEVGEVLDKIARQTKPVSIFIYGSRARKDFKKDSDYEVGVIYKQENYIHRRELKKMHSLDCLNIFPFFYKDFIKHQIDTPFPKAVYLRDVILGGRTFSGVKIVENTKPPSVSLTDLLEVVIFQQAYALAATHSFKQGDLVTSATHFIKSLLYALRVLVIIGKKKFPLTFDEIVKEAKGLKLKEEDVDLIQHAIDVRNGIRPELDKLYANISFLNMVVLKKVKKNLLKGNRVILQ